MSYKQFENSMHKPCNADEEEEGEDDDEEEEEEEQQVFPSLV